ncbi:MAG: DUF3575 domain-containing protein [Bacteroidaceae bacterium]|nr:DUF3575 domain-containing protein [Bacteroidaceae bacterium]
MKRYLFFLLISLATVTTARAQMLALKTDVAADALFVPNMGVELVTGNKTSFNLSLLYAYHPLGTDLRSFVAMPEFRYWFGGRALTSWFCGLSALGGSYRCHRDSEAFELGLRAGRLYKGNVLAGGATCGYVWNLGRKNRWNMEVSAGVGLYYYRQLGRYVPQNADGTPMDATDYENDNTAGLTEKGLALLPYKLGLTFAYIIK